MAPGAALVSIESPEAPFAGQPEKFLWITSLSAGARQYSLLCVRGRSYALFTPLSWDDA